VATGWADGEEIIERSGTWMRRCGGGKELRNVTRMSTYGGRKEIVGRSGNRMRRWRRDSREKWRQNAQIWRGKRDRRKGWQQDAQMEKR
jgi:hypothetical protein